ncbi:hypothetical protein [Simiduia aestuariiviva]|uniref:Tryptophan synthase subunit beta like protein n=1 Tax=Simiduia aestuariiviva TaxID=1510459 RepID=A0A839UQ99_9GAMM|nr:hypothetical protein [Simiduia aestuariiviva]MBB3168006.1 hypothetical protein [Simiduia aestuariiviva]
MPFVKRDTMGRIVSLHGTADEASEQLSSDHPEVERFLAQSTHPAPDAYKRALAESDQDIARVTEDLIHLLVNKNLILFTDLPPVVQKKLLDRERLRSHLQQREDNFLDDSELL